MIIYCTESGSKLLVTSIVFDESNLSEEEKNRGIEIDYIPYPEDRQDKIPIMYYDPISKSVYYEYIDKPPVDPYN